MKKIIIFGKGILVIDILEFLIYHKDKYEILFVIGECPYPSWAVSLQELCTKKGINYLTTIKDLPRDTKCDLIISASYKKRIPNYILQNAKEAINIHLSPLPKYRGVNSINWALKNNEKEHGVTIHRITSSFDAGDILAQIKFSIYPKFEEVIDVYRKSLNYAFHLFVETMFVLNLIVPRKQDEKEASYYSDEDRHLLEERYSFMRDNVRLINNED